MKLSVYMLNATTKDISGIYRFKRSVKTGESPIENKQIKKRDIKGYRKGLLFFQKNIKKQNWLEDINPILSKPFLVSDNVTYKAVLILQVNRRYMAISFNNGISLVKSQYVDYDFGFIMAQKLLKKDTISSFDTVDVSKRIMNVSKKSSQNIPIYLVKGNTNMSTITSLTGKNENNKIIRGKYKLELEFHPDLKLYLMETLVALSNTYYSDQAEKIELPDNLKQITTENQLNELDNLLVQQIQKNVNEFIDNKKLKEKHLKNIDLNIEMDFQPFKISGLSYSKKIFETINKFEYFERLCWQLNKTNKTEDEVFILNKLKRDCITSEDESERQTIYNSLIVQFDLEKYKKLKAILIMGKWYFVNRDYYSNLISKVDSIKKDTPHINFMPFTKTHSELKQGKLISSEGKYNEDLATSNNIYLFDKKLYQFDPDLKERYELKDTSKMEPCDVLKYDSQEGKLYFIHNKVHSGASGISHLVTQSNICADLITNVDTKSHFINYLNTTYENLNVPVNISRENIIIILGVIEKKYTKECNELYSILELEALTNTIEHCTSKGLKIRLQIIPNRRI